MELRQASSVADLDGGTPLHGGTEVVPLMRAGILKTDVLVDIRKVVPRGIEGTTIGAGTSLAELEASEQLPEALREACRAHVPTALRATACASRARARRCPLRRGWAADDVRRVRTTATCTCRGCGR